MRDRKVIVLILFALVLATVGIMVLFGWRIPAFRNDLNDTISSEASTESKNQVEKDESKLSGYTFTNTVNGVDTVIYLPETYNDKVKNKYVIYVHGANRTATYISSAKCGDLLSKLLTDGFVVIATTGATKNSWGNPQSSIDIQDLVNYYKPTYNLEEKPYVFMQSMGGIVTMNAVAKGYLTPKAIAGVFPALNLRDMYDNGWEWQIRNAYGFTNKSEYNGKTAGCDPMLSDFTKYKDIPFYILSSYSDTVVSTIRNRDLFKAKLLAAGGSITTVDTKGEHTDLSNYQSDNIIKFFNEH
ncbi:MAG: hypothetical protein ABRQ27_02455 [Clostridiaceae bacterium]